MKALAKRAKACAGIGKMGAATIILWASALGQATPDNVITTEPSTVLMFGAGLALVAWITTRNKK